MVGENRPWSTTALQQRAGRSKLISKMGGPLGAIRIALGERCMLHSEQPTAAVAIFILVAVILCALAKVFSH